jgi:hypothetical protein
MVLTFIVLHPIAEARRSFESRSIRPNVFQYVGERTTISSNPIDYWIAKARWRNVAGVLSPMRQTDNPQPGGQIEEITTQPHIRTFLNLIKQRRVRWGSGASTLFRVEIVDSMISYQLYGRTIGEMRDVFMYIRRVLCGEAGERT